MADAIAVTVRLYAGLGREAGAAAAPERRCCLPAAAAVGDLLARLEIAPDDVGVVVINGRVASKTAPLADGDEVGLFPPLAGG